jgi:hypothetical protein
VGHKRAIRPTDRRSVGAFEKVAIDVLANHVAFSAVHFPCGRSIIAASDRVAFRSGMPLCLDRPWGCWLRA